ncbi:MAG: hypothetical protein ABIQ79_03595 [Nitrospiraceae bacterium]
MMEQSGGIVLAWDAARLVAPGSTGFDVSHWSAFRCDRLLQDVA